MIGIFADANATNEKYRMKGPCSKDEPTAGCRIAFIRIAARQFCKRSAGVLSRRIGMWKNNRNDGKRV
ncbi:MAG: hypothetical protein ACLUD0_01425 [Eubacterium ramulus]